MREQSLDSPAIDAFLLKTQIRRLVPWHGRSSGTMHAPVVR
jgi:hypothetical protein